MKRQFEDHNVRFIAAADGFDTANGFDIMSIFRDVINEYYVAEGSKKVRAAKRAGALKGRVQGRVAYGYYVDENDKSVYHIDEEVAENVREIYRRIVGGENPTMIAKDFNSRGIISPNAYYRQKKGLSNEGIESRWFLTSVKDLLRKPIYTGTYVAQKETTASYKSRKIITRPEEEWVVIENHHPAIIDKETYDIVRRLSDARTKPLKTGIVGALTGLIYCSDCGAVMRRQNPAANRGHGYYLCSKYVRAKARYNEDCCSRHSIRTDAIENLVLTKIRETVADAVSDKEAFATRVRNNTNKESERTLKIKTAELVKLQRRVTELDAIIKRIYEDNISGRLSNERFDKMLNDYESEQSAINPKVELLNTEVEGIKEKQTNIEVFLNLAEQHAEINELTADIARTFISRIEVHEAVRSEVNPHTVLTQEVDIYFIHIGAYERERRR